MPTKGKDGKIKPKPKRLEVQGEMTVSIAHHAKVELQVCEGWGLGNYDPFGLSDPYVTLQYPTGKKIGKTKVRDNTLDPHFYERWTLRVPVEVPAEGGEDLTLEVGARASGGARRALSTTRACALPPPSAPSPSF